MIDVLKIKPDYLPDYVWKQYQCYEGKGGQLKLLVDALERLIDDKNIWLRISKKLHLMGYCLLYPEDLYSNILSPLIRTYAASINTDSSPLRLKKDIIEDLHELQEINKKYLKKLKAFDSKSDGSSFTDDIGWPCIAWGVDYPEVPMPVPPLFTLLSRFSDYLEFEANQIDNTEPLHKGKSNKQELHSLARQLAGVFVFLFGESLPATCVRCINAFFGDIYTNKDFKQAVKNSDLMAIGEQFAGDILEPDLNGPCLQAVGKLELDFKVYILLRFS